MSIRNVLAGVLVVYTLNVSAQCGCCSSSMSSSSVFSESGASSGLEKGVVNFDLSADLRTFSPTSTSTLDQLQLTPAVTTNLRQVQNYALSIYAGLSPHLLVGLQQGFMNLQSPTTHLSGQTDLTVFAGWNFVRESCSDKFLLVSAGLELPTGSKATFADQPQLRISTSALDPFVQVQARKKWNRHALQASSYYRYTMYDDDMTRLSRSFRTRVLYARDFKHDLNAQVGLTYDHTGDLRMSGQRVLATTNLLSATLGGNWKCAETWRVGAMVSIPILQSIEADAQKTTGQFRIVLSKTINFNTSKK